MPLLQFGGGCVKRIKFASHFKSKSKSTRANFTIFQFFHRAFCGSSNFDSVSEEESILAAIRQVLSTETIDENDSSLRELITNNFEHSTLNKNLISLSRK